MNEVIAWDLENRVYCYSAFFGLARDSVLLDDSPEQGYEFAQRRFGVEDEFNIYFVAYNRQCCALMVIVGQNEQQVRQLLPDVKRGFGLENVLELNEDVSEFVKGMAILGTAVHKLRPRGCPYWN